MKVLTTERLLLEEASLDDAAFFLTLLNSKNWIDALGDKKIRTITGAAQYIQNSLVDSYQKHGYGLYKVSLKNNGVPIGICGFVKRDYLNQADIGYGILPKYEGKGYAFEAAKATMIFGKITLGFQTILAITDFENKKSRYLLNKLGLFETGTINPSGKEELLLFSDKK